MNQEEEEEEAGSTHSFFIQETYIDGKYENKTQKSLY